MVSPGMRDRRFVAAHRGGPLDREDHALLARWAADCAERVLPLFARTSDDSRPKRAIEVGRAWAKGEVRTGAAMKTSVAAHAAARQVADKAAIAAARAAGQAVASAHFADHSMGALLYALKAMDVAVLPWKAEMKLRLARLPVRLRRIVAAGVKLRLKPLGVGRSAGK